MWYNLKVVEADTTENQSGAAYDVTNEGFKVRRNLKLIVSVDRALCI